MLCLLYTAYFVFIIGQNMTYSEIKEVCFYSLAVACVLLYILKWGGLFCCLFLFIIIVIACHDDQLTKYAEGNVSSNSECKLLTHVHQMLCFCVQYVNKSIQEKYIQQVFDAILSSPEIENIQPRLGQWFFFTFVEK